MPNAGVYKIKNLKNGKCYIGSASHLQGRWRCHRSDLNLGQHHSIKLQRAWDKYGSDAFMFEILELCRSPLYIEREQHYLDTMLFASSNDSRFDELGYNICRVAGSSPMIGRKHSAETRIKMSKAHKGQPSPNRGHKATPETIERLRLSHLGKRLGEYKGSKHPQSKLDDNDVQQIKSLIEQGMKGKDIAKRYSVSDATISMIKNKRHWEHIHA